MTERIGTLTRNRDAIADYLEAIRVDAAPADVVREPVALAEK